MGEQYFDGLRGRNRLVRGNGHHRKLQLHQSKSYCNGGIKHQNEIVDLSSPDNNSYGSKNVSLFRRSSVDNNSKHETKNNIGGQHHLAKGKAICSIVPSQSVGCTKDGAFFDLTEQNGDSQPLEMAIPHGRLRNLLAEERREDQLSKNGDSFLHTTLNSSGKHSNTRKGKEKMDDNHCENVGSVLGVAGKRRLVRNGCISPENMVVRTKQFGEHIQNSLEDVEQNHIENIVSGSPSRISIADIIAGENNYRKGKGVIDPHTSMEHNINMINLSSSPINCTEEASGTNDSRRDAGFEDKVGWRRTHNCSKKVDPAAGHHSIGVNGIGSQVHQLNGKRTVKRDNVSGENSWVEFGCDCPESQDAPQAASSVYLNHNRTSEPSKATNMLHTRQRKRELNLRNLGKVSRVVSDNSDIMCPGSSGESSSRSSRFHNELIQNNLNLGESYGMRQTDSHDDLEAKARQVEADEKLARELQEQLYHEVPIFGNGEIDENIAWALQQEEDAIPTATFQNHDVSNPRSTRHSLRQPQLRSSLNSSTRRRSQPRLPTPQMSRLVTQFLNRTRAAPPSRTRNFEFPLGMELDMRLDILEALEAADADLADIGPLASIFHAQRDFNENDYEMLLALDENNHQHGGASVHQINSLPQSVVQTDNFEEACAICLETPVAGETIRHLPCLHKFHKDCIDQWLSRKTSCPVCKLSIT
ncbi:hypothetical protein SLE2022_153910 [Rubroshorea leprosula]